MATYIGIDLGTSSVKLLAIDEDGTPLHQCQREYHIDQPNPGWKEIDPCHWIDAIEEGLKELFNRIDKKKIRGIGVTGQMHTLICLDAMDKPIRPALMWNDVRTKSCVETLKPLIENHKDTTFIRNILSTGSPAANLYWLKENEPANFKAMTHFLIGPDYIVHYLTGKITTDYCEASTSSLYDIKTQQWSKTMQKAIGLSPKVYPKIWGSGEIVGSIQSKFAQKFDLNPEIYVIAGTGDNPAAAVATGCIHGDFPVLSLGTSGVLMIRKERLEQGVKGKNILFSIDNKKISYLVQGVVQSAGSSHHWITKTIFHADNFLSEAKNTHNGSFGRNELLFYPHLVGDKTLYKDPSLKGAFFGLGTETTRQDLLVSVMEGIGFAIKELSEAMGLSDSHKTLKVTGGGAKNDVWMQILADILNKNIEQLEGNEGAALGIALLTKDADPQRKEEAVKPRKVSIKKLYTPKSKNVDWYLEKYKKYKKIYEAIKNIYA